MILEPPQHLDHPYPGVVVEVQLTMAQIIAQCGRGAYACSWPPLVPGGTCHIWLPIIGRGGVGARTQAVLRRHENAHCIRPDWHRRRASP